MPRELGIPFSAELISPIVADLKTVTRRIVNPQPEPDGYGHGMWIWRGGKALLRATYGADYVHTDEWALRRAIEKCARHQVGDRLYVKECWRTQKELDAFSPAEIAAKCADAGYKQPWAPILYTADKVVVNFDWSVRSENCWSGEWGRVRTGRFMPKWAARTWIEVLDLRAERLQEITFQDCEREGIPMPMREMHYDPFNIQKRPFIDTWDKLHGRDGHGWDTNPWVVRYEFHRIQP